LHNRDDLNFVWRNLPDSRKKKEGDYLVLIRREGHEVWHPLRDTTTAEFCLLRATAKALESNRMQILRRQLARK
jgi:hypothetical protein